MLPLPSTATAWPVSAPVPPKRCTQGPAVEAAPAWVTVNACPAMLSVPVRELVLVLAATDHVTVPLPVPLAGVQLSQAALLDGVQAQPVPPATLSVPLLAAEPGAALPGEMV